LTLKDGGTCYLDAFGDGKIGDAPIPASSQAPVWVAGWAVADLNGGRLGDALGVELKAATSYFLAADSYVRPGLGAALKHPSLDGGGLKIDPTPLNVPAGDYGLFFLIQDNRDLLRCDTSRTVRIQ
jgi:hypothetical protein